MIIVKGLEIDLLIKIRIFRNGCTRERGNSGASRIGYDWIERQEGTTGVFCDKKEYRQRD